MSDLARQSERVFSQAAEAADPAQRGELLHRARHLAGHDALADAYGYLQKAVGLIAVTLPFAVAIGHEVLPGRGGMKGSISAYYYTHMGNYFVGSLFALGVFFLSYNYKPLPGYRVDYVLSNVASAMAIGVALFPTSSDGAKAHGGAAVVAAVHLVFAGILFALLGVFSYFLFTKSGDAPKTPRKIVRNRVYRTCGITIFASLVVIAITEIVKPPRGWHALFWLESLSVVAFGVSWLVKGELVLGEPKPAAA